MQIFIIMLQISAIDSKIEFYKKTAELSLIEKNSNLYALSISMEGYLNYVIGNFDKAADLLSSNEKYCIDNKLDNALSKTYMGLGYVYRDLGAAGKSLEFFGKCHDIAKKIGDYQYVFTSLNEIGNVYLLSKNYEKAISYHKKSIEIKEEHNDTIALCYSYNDISLDYSSMGDYEKALFYLFKSLEIAKLYNMDYLIIANYINISDIYTKTNKVEKAEEILNIAKDLAYKIKVKGEQASVYNKLSEIKAFKQDYKSAYEYYVMYKNYSDSILNEGVVNKLNELSARYEFEKNKKEIELLNKDKELKQSEIERHKIYTISLIIGVILLVLFLGVVINRFLLKKKANVALSLKNEEITQQKEEIQSQRDEIEAQRDKLVFMNEEISAQRDLATSQRDEIAQKSKEISDSINYAKQIQQAMLPSLSPKLQNSSSKSQALGFGIWNLEFDTFVLFRPKDIVSGDFYWYSKVNDYSIYAVADCTGHGVPGAFMSMLGISFLNEIVAREEINSPSLILDELRQYIITSLQQKDGTSIESLYSGMKDGMDISLIAIKHQAQSPKTQDPSEENSEQFADNDRNQTNQTNQSKISVSDIFQAQWAGANNPLWVVRSDETLTGLKTLSEFSEDASANIKHETSTELASSTKLNLKLLELKPDKMPISIHPIMKPFTTHELKLYKGDSIYLFTDGYADQFGGKNGKKFLYSKFKEIIISNSQKSMIEQNEILESNLEKWMCANNTNYEQTDDITVVGIRL